MSCKYHPSMQHTGSCMVCETEYCAECGVDFSGGTLCADCAAQYASKKIFHGYIAIAIGFVGGIVNGIMAGGAMILILPILCAYSLFVFFWGWHYTGRIWPWLGQLAVKVEGGAGLVVFFFILWLRVILAATIGAFGGGIVGYLRCRKLLRHREALAL